jgi:hypothetical protein
MIETTPSLQQVALQARLAQAAICLAHREAQAAVKREIQRQGRRKLSQIAHREIVAMANEYLAEHRVELIAEAKAIVEEWRGEGFFGKRAARELERNSQVTSKEERTATQGLLLNESHAQNGAVK